MLRILAVVLLLGGPGLANAEPVFPPGLRVGLEPAADLKTAPGTAGFQDIDRKATVAIAELPPASYNELTRAMFGQVPAGASHVARTLFSFRDGIGYLHEARVVENGIATKRWLFLAMPAGLKHPVVALVNVSVPEAARKIYSDAAVRKMLASITFRQPPIDEQLSLIPFKLKDLAGFRVVSVRPDSVLAVDGPDDEPSQRSYMIVSVGRTPPSKMDDRARFSRDLLATMPLRNLTPQSAEEMRVSGSPGFEIRAHGEDLRNNKVSIVQWVRFVGSGFVRVVGVSPNEQWDEMFTRFRAARDAVELR